MSYTKDLLKMRNMLEAEVNNLLAQFSSESEKNVVSLNVQYQDEDSEMEYAVEVNREPHLVLVNIQSGAVWYDIEPGCIELEELAEIADKLHYLNLKKKEKKANEK